MENTYEGCSKVYKEYLKHIKNSSISNLNSLDCDKTKDFDNLSKENTFNGLHDLNDKCYRVTQKRESFYIHKYNPEKQINLIKNLALSEKNENKILDCFDLEPRENCCNCVSIVLYSKGDIYILFQYLFSLKVSLDNIANNLEGFICRFYIDPTVFEVIKNTVESDNEILKNKCYEYLEYIITHERAEIYIYFCESIVEKKLPIEKSRTLRFLTLFEKDVNISVIREADGIVGYGDCHNIKLFSKSDKIAMFYEYSNSFSQMRQHVITHQHYSLWLRVYDDLKKIYFENKILVDKKFDILAGTFCCKLKFKKIYLREKINLINCLINNKILIEKTIQQGKDKHKNDYKGATLDNIIKTLNLGYDEILLMELFEPLTTLDSQNIKKQNIKKLCELLDEENLSNSRQIEEFILENSNMEKVSKIHRDLYYYMFDRIKDDIFYYNEFDFERSLINSGKINLAAKKMYNFLIDLNYRFIVEEKKDKFFNINLGIINQKLLNNFYTDYKSLENINNFEKFINIIYPSSKQLMSYDNIFKAKYLKYKSKYLKLKMNRKIAHK